jgi:hypothetical protein
MGARAAAGWPRSERLHRRGRGWRRSQQQRADRGTQWAPGRLHEYSARVDRRVWRDRIRTGVLTLVVFALAHNLTFLVTFGDTTGAALERTGHGPEWGVTAALVVLLGVSLIGAGLVRLLRLSRAARDLGGGASSLVSPRRRDLILLALRAWVQILGCALAIFMGAENLERLAAGLPTPGPAVLMSGEYHFALVVFALVALVAAFVEALYRWRRDELVALIAAARTRWARNRAPAPRARVAWVDRSHAAVARHRIAGRAPPVGLC